MIPTSFGAYPLKDIPHPHPHDVLCGRGGGTNNHVGNSHWRMLVAANKQLYITLPKRQKMLLSRSIVNAVRSQNPPGRFLQKDSKSNSWFDVGDQRAQEKTSQALREGAPDIRSKISQEKNPSKTKQSEDDVAEKEGDGDDSKKDEKDGDSNSNSNSKNGNKGAAVSSGGSTTSSGPKSGSKSAISSPFPMLPVQGPGAGPGPVMVPPSTTSVGPGGTPQMMPPNMPMPPGMAPGMPGFPGMPPHISMPGATPFPATSSMSMPGAGNNSQPVMFYTGPNMAPVPMYPTMIINEQGMMVPAMSPIPPMMPPMAPPNSGKSGGDASSSASTEPKSNKDSGRKNAKAKSGTAPSPSPPSAPKSAASGELASAEGKHGQSQTSSHPKASGKPSVNFAAQPTLTATPSNTIIPGPAKGIDNSENGAFPPGAHQQNIPSFDEYMASLPPGALEPAGLSWGTMSMADATKLEPGGLSFGSMMSYTTNAQQSDDTEQKKMPPPPLAPKLHGQGHNEQMPAAVGALGPAEYSFGDVSMVSTGAKGRLENTGTSFGSMMSVGTFRADMVEGGLEAIGTSFGSLSIDAANREALYSQLEAAAAGPEIPPMFQAQRSTGNLLECSDTESDDSGDEQVLVAQKSAAWEKLQASVAAKTRANGNKPMEEPIAGPTPLTAQQQQQIQQIQQQRLLQQTIEQNQRQLEILQQQQRQFEERQRLHQQQQRQQHNQHGDESGYSNMAGAILSIPTTNLESNFSTLSTMSMADGGQGNDEEDDMAAMPPPPPMVKQTSDNEKLEMLYLQRGSSLALDDF